MSDVSTQEAPPRPSRNDVPTLTIERKFKQPPAAVFKAWTDPAALRQWMGPAGFTCPSAEMEARVGGAYVFPMLSPDGDLCTVRGVIREIVPDRMMRFSWAWDQPDGGAGQMMEVTLEFHKSGKGTRLVLHHSNFIDQDAHDKHEYGWTGCLDSLGVYLEGLGG